MWKRKIAWLIVIVCACIMYLFENNAGTLIVLISVTVIPGLMIILSKLVVGCIKIKLVLPDNIQKNQVVYGKLLVENRSLVFVLNAKCKIAYHNELTGEIIEHLIHFGIGGKKEESISFELTVDHCGNITVKIRDCYVQDVFGIQSFEIHEHVKKNFVILPNTFNSEIQLSQGTAIVTDSDKYSMTKHGSDPSEIFNIREYIPGDLVKRIHWKLSQKNDKLMVRELSLPIINQVLLLIETSILPECEKVPADVIDAMIESFASISKALTNEGIEHTVGWKNMKNGNYEFEEINQANDLAQELGNILSNPVQNDITTISECFLNSHTRCNYAHVIIVSPYIGSDIAGLYNNNKVTVLLASENNESNGMHSDGVYVISFNKKSYGRDLCKLEI